MGSIFALIKRNINAANPPKATKEPNALRFGILGAARIAPNAFITPALSHPDVVIVAVAARDERKAKAYAKKHGIEKAYFGKDGYQQLLDDPNIDAIYNPLPNGLHYEWTLRALAAGKHVLLEKPSCNTAAEAKKLFAYAQEKNVVLLEAFHYRFHPGTHRIREILNSGELGKVKSLSGKLAVPAGTILEKDDIRLKYELGGGATMDMGVYPLSFIRYLTGAEPTSVESAVPAIAPNDKRIDRAMQVSLNFPNDVTADVFCDMALPPWGIGPFKFIPHFPKVTMEIKCEGGEIFYSNFVAPWIWHSIKIKSKKGARTETAYKPKSGKGEDWWTTYRHQLEVFVDKIRGREPASWMSAEDSIAQMEAVDKIYEKSGLPLRTTSTYELP